MNFVAIVLNPKHSFFYMKNKVRDKRQLKTSYDEGEIIKKLASNFPMLFLFHFFSSCLFIDVFSTRHVKKCQAWEAARGSDLDKLGYLSRHAMYSPLSIVVYATFRNTHI